MRKPLTFFEMQLIQREHDLRNHIEIYTLPMFSKINHYVLHFTKYARRLTPEMDDAQTLKELRRTYIDAFLIGLSCANALNIDLDKEMLKKFGSMANSIGEYVVPASKFNISRTREISRDTLIMAAGAMADALEKRDHLDDIDSKAILFKETVSIMKMILYGSAYMKFDIVSAVLDRRKQIAELKVT